MTAAVVASPTASGATRCTSLRSDPPISLRETPEALFLVGSGAGPVGGDHLGIDVEVRRGASLVVRSAAASMVLPGRSGSPSSLHVTATVAGQLRWEPEPTILVAGCDHRAVTEIDLDPGATLLWREVVVLGRHAEATGSVLHRLHVDRGGVPLLRTELPVGPRWPGAGGPAGTDGARVLTSLLVIGRPEPAPPPGVRSAVLSLAEDAWLLTALSS